MLKISIKTFFGIIDADFWVF